MVVVQKLVVIQRKFFNIQMDGLQAERNYSFCIKVVSGSGYY